MKELLSIEDPIAGLLGAWSAGLNLGSALLRIALIVALAASIGCERSSKRHSAGLRTFVLAAFSATVSMLLDQYVYVLLGCKVPLLSAATLLAVTSVSANSLFLPGADQGTDHLGGTGELLHSGLRHRRGAVCPDADRVRFPALYPRGLPCL